jgi:hypothetical protein
MRSRSDSGLMGDSFEVRRATGKSSVYGIIRFEQIRLTGGKFGGKVAKSDRYGNENAVFRFRIHADRRASTAI